MDPVDEELPNPIVDAFAGLVNEHVQILSLADSFEVYGQMLKDGNADPADLIKFCVFFREFGAMIHHEKEERIAFAALSLHGFQPGAVPRAQIHEEHEQEHAMLLHVIRFALKELPWDGPDRERIGSLAAGYAAYLRTHLAMEEERLYPALRSTLAAEELASVGRKLARFDETHNVSGQLEWLFELAQSLKQKYLAH